MVPARLIRHTEDATVSKEKYEVICLSACSFAIYGGRRRRHEVSPRRHLDAIVRIRFPGCMKIFLEKMCTFRPFYHCNSREYFYRFYSRMKKLDTMRAVSENFKQEKHKHDTFHATQTNNLPSPLRLCPFFSFVRPFPST